MLAEGWGKNIPLGGLPHWLSTGESTTELLPRDSGVLAKGMDWVLLCQNRGKSRSSSNSSVLQ